MNSVVRFFLEIFLLVILGKWAFELVDSSLKYLLMIFLPMTFAILWGVFAVRGDPSRSGKTVIATPGWVRLILELSMFGFGGWCLFDLEFNNIALVYSASVIIHYLADLARIKWLLEH